MDTKLFRNFFCLFLVVFPDCGQTIRWLSLQHANLQWNANSVPQQLTKGIRSNQRSSCQMAKRRFGLARIQVKLCSNSHGIMPQIQRAATLASETCKSVFELRRWNCSAADSAPYLTPDLTRGTREQAYLYALSSATLTHSLARACATGNLHQCSCAASPHDQPTSSFKWGGCGDNVKWAMQFAKKFTDTPEKIANQQSNELEKFYKIQDQSLEKYKINIASVNLHNNRLGRRLINQNLVTECKCHGVSGSCSIKTCWRALPTIGDVGKKLLGHYTTAQEVSKNFESLNVDVPQVPGRKSPFPDQLIYFSKSPDYCTKDERLGSLGTVGRKCNVSSKDTDSCRQLCCGRGHRTVVEEKIERCYCQYYYCCYVKCKTCRTYAQVNECV